MGVHRGVISNTDGAEILARYYLNVAGMIHREGSEAVAAELVGRARDLLPGQAYNRFRRHYQV
jgi:hypothetical protein